MVKSLENGGSLPPFLVKCYEMVSDESTDEVISWTESDNSFIIWDESRFASQLLPKYFKHGKFSSFVRQLNTYGFRKVDTDRWQFANEAFIKGQKHLLQNIKRRRHPQNNLIEKKSSQPKDMETPQVCEDNKSFELWKEVENLKIDRNALMQELKKLRQHQKISQSELLLLRGQLKGMEKKQQQMLAFLATVMQNPEFMAQFFQPKNARCITETGMNKLSEVTDACDPTPPPDGAIVRYQPPKDGHLVDHCTTEASTSDNIMEFYFSSEDMRDLMDIDFLLGSTTDEKLLPMENHMQFVLPDMPENDAILEELLVPYSSVNNGQLVEVEAKACTDSVAHIGSAFQQEESDKPNSLDVDGDEYNSQITEVAFHRPTGNSEKVECVTKQMGYLNSEICCGASI